MPSISSRRSRSTTWPSIPVSALTPDPPSGNQQVDEEKAKLPSPPLPRGGASRGWKARSEWWTWNCFTVNMGTGGVAILIGGCPFTFTGQRELGTVFFMIDLVIFLINVAGVTSRAIYHSRVFKNSFYDHEDGIYVPCFALAFATLFVCTLDYGVPYVGRWLVTALQALWFVYIAVGLLVAMTMEYTVRGSLRPLAAISPADCLLVFPLMLGGTTGSALAAEMPAAQASYIIIISYMLQGMGWFLSLMKLSVWMCRSILLPTPPPESIFQFLMAVGPPGYTAFAYMNLARTARYAFPAAGLLDEGAARIFQIVSIWYSLPLFGLALYLWITPLVLYTIGIIKIRKFQWTMAFWSLTFPTTGMFMASVQLGEQLPSKIFKIFQVFGIFFVASAWLLNIVMTLYSIWGSNTLLQAKPKRTDDFYAYHGLHQGQVIEDTQAMRAVPTRYQDVESGKTTPIKRYMAEYSNGA